MGHGGSLATGVIAEYRQLMEELEARGIAPPQSFHEFVARHNPSLLEFEHVPRLIRVAQKLADGIVTRLLVILPPRYFKSEVFSRLLTAYFVRQNPHLWTTIISYGADLAWEMSEDARNHYEADGGALRSETGAKKRWRTNRGGGLWAYGVGGSLLGRGFSLGIVDDPVDPEKVDSPKYQKRWRSWWPGKFLSRQEPNARIVVVMQRLGMDDPIDFLLKREQGTDEIPAAPEYWHVVHMDEIKSSEPLGPYDGPAGLPSTCTLEEDPREEGQILAPSRFSREDVELLRRAAGPYVTSAQRQGRPMEPKGDFWNKDWFRSYDVLPGDAYDGGKDWDTAYTKDEANAASGYIESYRGPGPDGSFPIYIHDVDWDWVEFPALVEWMKGQQGPHYIEARASGKSAKQSLSGQGVAAHEVEVKGDKLARSAAVQPIVSNKRVFVRQEVWSSLLLGERQGLLRVTAERLKEGGDGLDVNDMFVQALTRHVGLHQRRVWVR